MKKIECESCGSTELKLQNDGSYKCDFCGSRYWLDENDIIQDTDIVDADIITLYFEAEKYRQENKYNLEIQVLTKAIECDRNKALTWVKLGRAYRMCDLIDKAIDCYYKAIDLDPLYAQSYTNIGTAYILKKDYAKSVEYFEKGMPLLNCTDGDYPVILANYAIAIALTGNKIKGARLLNKAERQGYQDGDKARCIAGLSYLSKFLFF